MTAPYVKLQRVQGIRIHAGIGRGIEFSVFRYGDEGEDGLELFAHGAGEVAVTADGIRPILMILEYHHHHFGAEFAAMFFQQFMHPVITQPGIREGGLVILALMLEIMGLVMIGMSENTGGLWQNDPAFFRGGLNIDQLAVFAADRIVEIGGTTGLGDDSDGIPDILLV